jgi:hypothetical protein
MTYTVFYYVQRMGTNIKHIHRSAYLFNISIPTIHLTRSTVLQPNATIQRTCG